MATAAEIKKTILDLTGNPSSGVVFENVDTWAEAIANLDKPRKEARVIEAEETR